MMSYFVQWCHILPSCLGLPSSIKVYISATPTPHPLCRSGNVIGVCVNEDGSYLANWVPQRPGTYQLQLKLDGKEAGITKELTVNPIPLEESSLPKDSSEEDTEVEKTQLEVITLKVGQVLLIPVFHSLQWFHFNLRSVLLMKFILFLPSDPLLG